MLPELRTASRLPATDNGRCLRNRGVINFNRRIVFRQLGDCMHIQLHSIWRQALTKQGKNAGKNVFLHADATLLSVLMHEFRKESAGLFTGCAF